MISLIVLLFGTRDPEKRFTWWHSIVIASEFLVFGNLLALSFIDLNREVLRLMAGVASCVAYLFIFREFGVLFTRRKEESK